LKNPVQSQLINSNKVNNINTGQLSPTPKMSVSNILNNDPNLNVNNQITKSTTMIGFNNVNNVNNNQPIRSSTMNLTSSNIK
jgi:hypothetical protein